MELRKQQLGNVGESGRKIILMSNHMLTVDLHLEKVLLKRYGRMLKVKMG